MKKENLKFSNNLQEKYLNTKFRKNFSNKFNRILEQISIDIKNIKKAHNVLSENYKFSFKVKKIAKFKKFKTISIIGMGGSILGAEAVYNLFKKKIKKKVYFFNDLNIESILDFKKKAKLNKTLFIIISKSGDTIETLSNMLSLKIIKKSSKNILIISEKKNNFLFNLSRKFDLNYIEHNENLGGRFSVLSEVGIVPSYLMGINVRQLRYNLIKYLKNKDRKFLKDNVIFLASLLMSGKKNNLIFLNYMPELEKFLYWCQQLIAESLGKKGMGFLPIVSNVPKDHHSMLQLYLDGPKDKIFYIFSGPSTKSTKIKTSHYNKRFKFLENKDLFQIKTAQKDALINSFRKKKISFREIQINYVNEQTLGELFSYFILETIFVANLTNLNPFDQPAVEQVKIDTKKTLSKLSKNYF